ncbi:hypothetical protein D3C78_1434430 [compost metagenome]
MRKVGFINEGYSDSLRSQQPDRYHYYANTRYLSSASVAYCGAVGDSDGRSPVWTEGQYLYTRRSSVSRQISISSKYGGGRAAAL